jgi:hypothetical protein
MAPASRSLPGLKPRLFGVWLEATGGFVSTRVIRIKHISTWPRHGIPMCWTRLHAMGRHISAQPP